MVVIIKAIVSPIKKQGNDGFCKSAMSIGKAVKENATIFAMLNPSPDDGEKTISDLNDANTKAEKGSDADKAARNELRKLVNKVLNSWAAGVTQIADGDEEIIAKSKFPMGKKPSPVTKVEIPNSPKITDGNNAGKVLSRVLSVKGASRYQLRYTRKDPATAVDADYTVLTPGGTKTTVENLVPGTIYFYSARAIGARNTSGWSEPTMFMPSVI